MNKQLSSQLQPFKGETTWGILCHKESNHTIRKVSMEHWNINSHKQELTEFL